MNIGQYPVFLLARVFKYCSRSTLSSLFDVSGYFRKIILQYHDNIENFHLHDNQWDCGKEIVGHFFQGTRYVLLNAQPQSGKTGACQSVCFLVRQYAKQFGITNFWFICGMNDNNLKRQQIREFSGLIPEQNILFSKDLASFGRKRAEGKYLNSCSNHLSSLDGSISSTEDKLPEVYFRNSLIILDESHFAQYGVGNRVSMVHRFLSYQVGLTLDGFDQNWKGHNLWFLSVSATPMSELVHFMQPKQPKARVLLRPGDDYYGFEDMFQLHKVHSAFDLSEPTNQQKLVDVMKKHYRSQQTKNQYKYALIRFSNTGNAQVHRASFKALIDFPVKYIKFHSQEMSLRDINTIVNKVPEEFTIIEVYHSLRAGIQLNTKNICLVHETHRANTDVTAQGLAGRCCGYFKEEHDVDVYCHRDRLFTYCDLIATDFDPEYVPSNCTNIKQGHCEDAVDKFLPNVPMGGKMNQQLIDDMLQYKSDNPRRYPGFLEKFSHRIRSLDFISNRIWDSYHFVGVTILNELNKTKSKTSTWVKFWNPAFKAWKNRKSGAYFRNNSLSDDYDEFMYIYINLKKSHSDFGFILVTSQKRMSDVPLQYIRTTGKEEYHPENNPLEDLEFEVMLRGTILRKQRLARNEEIRQQAYHNIKLKRKTCDEDTERNVEPELKLKRNVPDIKLKRETNSLKQRNEKKPKFKLKLSRKIQFDNTGPNHKELLSSPIKLRIKPRI